MEIGVSEGDQEEGESAACPARPLVVNAVGPQNAWQADGDRRAMGSRDQQPKRRAGGGKRVLHSDPVRAAEIRARVRARPIRDLVDNEAAVSGAEGTPSQSEDEEARRPSDDEFINDDTSEDGPEDELDDELEEDLDGAGGVGGSERGEEGEGERREEEEEVEGDDGDEDGERGGDAAVRWWPPINPRLIRGRLLRQLPPRLASSPRYDSHGRPLKPTDQDFGITMTPCCAKPSVDYPQPVDPPDALRVAATYHFMEGCHKLFVRLHEVDKSDADLEDALKLEEAAGGAERGDKLREAHAQLAVRVSTRRPLNVTKNLLEWLLQPLALAHPQLWNRISVKPRQKQSQEYAMAYTQKDEVEGDLFNAPTPLPTAAGHFLIGLTPERHALIRRVYKHWASNMANKTAYSKGGANRPVRYTGKVKKYPIAKSSFLDLGYDLVEEEGFGEDGRSASAVRKTAWLLQKGYHFLAPSFFITYAKTAADEEQIMCGELVNNNPFRAEDATLVRKAMFNTYDPPSHIQNTRVAYRAPVLLQKAETEDMGLFEMRRWKQEQILPPRVLLRREFPFVPVGAKGQFFIADFEYNFPCSGAESSLTIARAFGNAGFNVTPHLYQVGEGETAGSGIDALAFRSVGVAYCVLSEFMLSSFESVTRSHVTSFLDHEWHVWCESTLATLEHTDTALTSRRMYALLKALQGPRGFSFDTGAWHGVLTPAALLASYEKHRPQVGDELRAKRTHIAIIAVEAAPPPAPSEVPADSAPADDTPEDAPVLAPPNTAEQAWERLGALGTSEFPNHNELHPYLLDVLKQYDGTTTNASDDAAPTDVPTDVPTDDPLPTDPLPTDASSAAAEATPPQRHHYLVAWRYGQHAIVARHVARENLTPYRERDRRARTGVGSLAPEVSFRLGSPVPPSDARSEAADSFTSDDYDQMLRQGE